MLAVGTWGPIVAWPGIDFPGTLAEGRSGTLREGGALFQKHQTLWNSVPRPMPHTLVRTLLPATPRRDPLLLPELLGTGLCLGALQVKGKAIFIQT